MVYMNKKIDIICFFDSLHKPLFDLFFKESFDIYLSENFKLVTHFENSANTALNQGHYQSDHWSSIIEKRIDFLRNYINTHNNNWAIFSDIDIIFLNNIYMSIYNTISTNYNNINIFYMPEIYFENKINGGFFLFRCCSEIDMFFAHIQELLKASSIKNDQPIIQELLNNNLIKYGLLDKDIFMTNNHDQYFILSKLSNIGAFHATSASNIWIKTQILSSIMRYKYPSSDRLWN
jgi:hypothetical protein